MRLPIGSTAQYENSENGLNMAYCGSPATRPTVQLRSVIPGHMPSRSSWPRCENIGMIALSVSSTRKNPRLRATTKA